VNQRGIADANAETFFTNAGLECPSPPGGRSTFSLKMI